MKCASANALVTKGDVQRGFEELEAGLLGVWKEGGTGPVLGEKGGYRAWYSEEATRLEPVARYLWGLVPYAVGGGKSRGWPRVLDAIVHGTDPGHPEYWGMAGTNDQRSVEMAAFGLALRLVPEKIWEPLSGEQKDRLASWLEAMVGKDLVQNNWQAFRLMVAMGLRHVGRGPGNMEAREAAAIELLDSYYLGDGWYSDGKGAAKDYYVPMAFHFYGLLLAKFSEGGPMLKRAAEWSGRAKVFGKDFAHWFGADGAALAFGRSLTYRFAQGAYWGGCGVAGVESLPWGQVKGMWLRNLRWWWKQPMLNSDGTLSLGYSYPNVNMTEPYNAYGSPYWAFKGMAPLMLPEDHPFWAAKEEMYDWGETPYGIEKAGMLVEHERGNGNATVYSVGQGYGAWPLKHRDAKYSKLVYSTYFGPTVGVFHEGLSGTGIDGTIAIQEGEKEKRDGTLWRARGMPARGRVEESFIVSDWEQVLGVKVRTWLVPLGAWHVRVHRVESDRAVVFAEGGFAAEDPNQKEKGEGMVLMVGSDGAFSGLVDLSGGREVVMNDQEPNSSLYFSRTKVPSAMGSVKAGVTWLMTGVFGAAPGSEAKWAEAPKVERGEKELVVQLGGKLVRISEASF